MVSAAPTVAIVSSSRPMSWRASSWLAGASRGSASSSSAFNCEASAMIWRAVGLRALGTDAGPGLTTQALRREPERAPTRPRLAARLPGGRSATSS
jgi:hypothetical protein